MKQIKDLLEYSDQKSRTESFYVIKGIQIWKDWDNVVPFTETFLEENMTQEDWAWILFFSSDISNLKMFSDFQESSEFPYKSMSWMIEDNPYISGISINNAAFDLGFVVANGWDEKNDSFEIQFIEYHDTDGKIMNVSLPTLSQIFKSYKEMREYFNSISD